jgi:hypothetical protein
MRRFVAWGLFLALGAFPAAAQDSKKGEKHRRTVASRDCRCTCHHDSPSEEDSDRRRVKGNNGVGNGIDPQPPGNPPVNDGPGTGPGNPGNRGGKAGKGKGHHRDDDDGAEGRKGRGGPPAGKPKKDRT